MFEKYKVDSIYRGKIHNVVLDTPADRLMRTVLRDYSREHRVDFAGHYKMALFGCGTACFSGAVIDVVTGQVIWLPFKELSLTDYFEPVSYCRNSRLIRFVGIVDESGPNTQSYYELKNGHF